MFINFFFFFFFIIKKYFFLKLKDIYVKYINCLECFCGYFYHTQDVLYMINELEKRKLEDQKKVYQVYPILII